MSPPVFLPELCRVSAAKLASPKPKHPLHERARTTVASRGDHTKKARRFCRAQEGKSKRGRRVVDLRLALLGGALAGLAADLLRLVGGCR